VETYDDQEHDRLETLYFWRMNELGPKDQLWARWNLLSGDERHAYFEHAQMLVQKGYLDNPENRDILEIALSIFAARNPVINKEK